MKSKIERKLHIYKGAQHIQTVTYVKSHGAWVATHFIKDKYMPFAIYEPLSSQKEALLQQDFTWKWA
jgi:hypothetical protein|tara:strand:- start:4702 stop:4902 length:201 start_codon:yes stop_codon:yes gene_type:complete